MLMANSIASCAMSYGQRLPRAARDDTDWLAHLPSEWRAMTREPLDFVHHHEYEMAACRCLGYDVDGELCYYAHGYSIDEARSDDGEEFYQVVAYSETVHAWRLRDERWLIHRIVHHCGEGAPGRGVYSFAKRCPR